MQGQNLTNEDAFVLGNSGRVNGRVDLISMAPKLNISNYQQNSVNNTSFYREAISGQLTRNPTSDLYFSPTNINAIQEGIKWRVYVESGKRAIIGRQSDTELKIIMRSIYLQYFENNPGKTAIDQVRELNARVLNWSIPEVLSNVLQYFKYRQDASAMPMPLERAQLDTKKGSRTLELKSFF